MATKETKAGDSESEHGESSDHDTGDGFDLVNLFDGNMPREWETVSLNAPGGTTSEQIEVRVQRVDEDPGASQSGFHLWPAARKLAQFVAENWLCDDWIDGGSVEEGAGGSAGSAAHGNRQLKVVELGCGMGLVSLTVGLLGTQHDNLDYVLATDVDETVLSTVWESYEETLSRAALNEAGRLKVQRCVWGETGETDEAGAGDFDVAVGSDLIYCPGVIRPLLATAKRMLRAGRHFYLCSSFAGYDEIMQDACTELGLHYVCVFDHLAEGGCKLERFTSPDP